MAPLVRSGGSRHTGLAAPPHRNIQGGYAVMVLETDQPIPEDSVAWFAHLEGVIKVTYLNTVQEDEHGV